MPRMMPVSDLQRNFKAVAEACAESGEPVYLTRNGYPALVVQDAEAYKREQNLKQLIYEREMRTLEAVVSGHDQIARGESTALEEARRMRERRRAE